jgi:hypothetical protein
MKDRAEQIQEFALRFQLYLTKTMEPITVIPSVMNPRLMVSQCMSCKAICEDRRDGFVHEESCEWQNLVSEVSEFLRQ